MTVSQWADNKRRLSPESSAEPGIWTTARAEYQRGIMDAVSNPLLETIVIMSSAQVGKTEILNNLVGYHIDQDPSPILVLQPTLEMAQVWSKDRLAPMLRDTPALKGKVRDPRTSKSTNTLLHKTFPGGHITMAGSNSPASLASRPIRVVMCDEVDRYPVSAGNEGDPVNLAKKRTATFWNRKIVMTSTPTIAGVSRIELEFEQSDKRYYHVPCPDCGFMQRLMWANVKWIKDENDVPLPDTAKYCCEKCASLWTDAQRNTAIKKGEWVATVPGGKRAGFHLSELYSPWSTLGIIVTSFLEARKNPEMLKTWVNTCLGETWEDRDGEVIDQNVLYARRVKYAAEVPEGALLLTAGIDVQHDRIEMEVVAWGEGEESWNVDYRVIPGDTTREEVWRDLEDALSDSYDHESGTIFHITSAVIDSSDQTTKVYAFVKRSKHQRLFAGKGVSGAGRPVAQVSRRGKGVKRRDVDLYTIGVDDAKGTVHARLKIEEPGPGYCHFPLERDLEYFQQLTAEKRVTRFHKGFAVKEWQKTRLRNEALDARVYAYAALKILNPVWSAISQRVKVAAPAPAPEKETYTEKAVKQHITRTRSRPGGGNWATGWKK